MATEKRTHRITLEEVALAALASKGITTGLWRLAVGLRFGGTTLEWADPEAKSKESLPTAIVGVVDLALIEADAPGPLVYDASTMRPSTPTDDKAPAPKPQRSAAKRPRAAGKPQTKVASGKLTK